jgi:hypothetical protein
MAFLCVSQQGARGVQKHHKKRFGENPRQKLFVKKLMTKNPVVFFFRFLLSRFFCRFSA